MLLILDNCEHLVHACAELARQLLQSAPALTILASSREPLHVAGEAHFPVAPLSVPDASRNGSLEEVAACEAVRLFVERATAVEPAFRLTAQNAAAVAQVCRRLDGIPLAIELAAARMRALPIDDIAARLDDCFRLLTEGDKTALPRQQTLRASIDWSYELLSAPERVLLRRLAAFSGGCTLEAAEAIGAGGEVGDDDVVDLLAHLVDKSLVSPDGTGRARYRLLETVRQYAHERLVAAGEADTARGKHLAYFLTLAEKARAGLIGPEQGLWLSRLDRERENLLSAHAWCDQAADGAELGLRLASATKLYWINRGLLGLGHRVALEALSRPGAQGRDTARCRALFDAGQISFYMGRYLEAQASLEESLAIAREADDKARIGAALQPLGMACVGRGDLGAARRHLEEALELARALGNQRNLAAALNARAQLDRIEGRLGEADTVYHEVLALARSLGDRESIAIGLLNLAMVAIARGDGHRARAMLLEVLAIAEEVGSIRVGQSALEVCAGLAASLGDAPRAARLHGVAEAQTAATGIHRDPADEAFLAPLVAQARASLAPEAFAAAEEAGQAIAYEEAIAEALAWLEGLPA
jgi:non-specific serine/threonine protein kinase